MGSHDITGAVVGTPTRSARAQEQALATIIQSFVTVTLETVCGDETQVSSDLYLEHYSIALWSSEGFIIWPKLLPVKSRTLIS